MNIPWHPHERSSSISLVAIDDRTLSDASRWGLGRWQEFKRAYYAQAIDNLKKHGAIAIGVDVLFSEQAEWDDILADSIKRAWNVTLGMSITRNSKGEEILYPTEKLREAARSIGYFQPLLDPTNDLVYSIAPVIKTNSGSIYEPFSLSTLRTYLDTANAINTRVNTGALDYQGYLQFHVGKYEFVPLSQPRKNEVLINYIPRDLSFPTISFADVYNDTFDPSLVKDKIVFVGATATALHDEFFTPIGIIYGVGVHLNLVNTLLTNSYLSYMSATTEYVILILLALALTLFLMHVENRIYQLAYSFIALTLGGFFYILVFGVSSKIFLNPAEIIIAVVLIAIAVTSYKYIYEEKWKRLLKNTLSQYLAEELVTAVLSNYQEVKLGWVRKEVTLFFSDIAGFTTFSERMEPEELVSFLSVYLKEVSNIIIHEQGFVNKYEWDAVMAIWGAFGLEDRQAYLACKAALLQQEAIRRMNEKFKSQFGFEITVRMGLNKWPAVVGNIGSEGKKIEYTALGDAVNTASRFEGINKLYHTKICVGQSIYESEQQRFVFRKLDSIMVKWKDLPVNIYELLCTREQANTPIFELIKQFETGLELYRSRRFEEAKEIFSKLIEVYNDGPSSTFLERSEKYIAEGCPEDWTGDYRATSK